MKKTFILACLLYTGIAFAQVTLEHTYSKPVACVQVANGEWNYVTNDTNTISIYDITHSLIENITIPHVTDYKLSVFGGYVSKNAFNTDANYEYVVSYSRYVSPPYRAQGYFVVYNDQGNTIFSSNGLDSCSSMGGIYATSSGLKMIVNYYNYYSIGAEQGNVYSLGGNFAGAVIDPNSNNYTDALPYPNPSVNYIHLTYSLPPGSQNGEMIIINNAGQVIRTIRIGNDFNNILFDTKTQSPGIYYYYIQTDNYKSETNKFIIGK